MYEHLIYLSVIPTSSFEYFSSTLSVIYKN